MQRVNLGSRLVCRIQANISNPQSQIPNPYSSEFTNSQVPSAPGMLYYRMTTAPPHNESAKTRMELIRFFASGGVVMAVDAAVYFLLLAVHVPVPAAKAIGFIAGGIVAFLINKYWTFQRKVTPKGESPKFIVANTLAMAINVSVNSGMIRLLGGHLLVALIVAKGVTSLFTFWIFKFWVFRHQE